MSNIELKKGDVIVSNYINGIFEYNKEYQIEGNDFTNVNFNVIHYPFNQNFTGSFHYAPAKPVVDAMLKCTMMVIIDKNKLIPIGKTVKFKDSKENLHFIVKDYEYHKYNEHLQYSEPTKDKEYNERREEYINNPFSYLLESKDTCENCDCTKIPTTIEYKDVDLLEVID